MWKMLSLISKASSLHRRVQFALKSAWFDTGSARFVVKMLYVRCTNGARIWWPLRGYSPSRSFEMKLGYVAWFGTKYVGWSPSQRPQVSNKTLCTQICLFCLQSCGFFLCKPHIFRKNVSIRRILSATLRIRENELRLFLELKVFLLL